jgi:hypothetical protein
MVVRKLKHRLRGGLLHREEVVGRRVEVHLSDELHAKEFLFSIRRTPKPDTPKMMIIYRSYFV